MSNSDADIPEAVVAHATLTVTNPLVVTAELDGKFSGCEEVGIPDLDVPGIGGLFFQVGGSIAAAVGVTITIAAGTYTLDGAFIPGSAPYATISPSCHDADGNRITDCVTTDLDASLTGAVSVSPLWLQPGPNEPDFVMNVGAGLTAAATAEGKITTHRPIRSPPAAKRTSASLATGPPRSASAPSTRASPAAGWARTTCSATKRSVRSVRPRTSWPRPRLTRRVR